MPHLPRFNYAITRDIRWRLEPYGYALAAIAIGILIPLNYALTGYETVTQPNVDYNYVPRHWYNRFAPLPKPGSRCDAWKFNTGDSFVTSPGIFTYQLTQVLGMGDGSGSSSSISYRGQTLDYCDVAYMSVTADTRFQTSSIVANIACTNEEQLFPVMFSTTFQSTNYDGASSTFDSKVNAIIGDLTTNNTLSGDVSLLVMDAGNDLTSHVTNAFQATPNHTGPTLITAYTSVSDSDTFFPPWWCPPATSKINTTCTTTLPLIWDSTSDSLTLLDADGNDAGLPSNSSPSNYSLAINNAMQAMLAAVRIDLGNILPNNLLVNGSSELIAKTIASVLPVQGASVEADTSSQLYEALIDPNTSVSADIEKGGSAQIALEYQCRVDQRKSSGSIFVAVIVATVTLFKSGWAVFLLLVTFLAKRAEPAGMLRCVD
ncbi:hypothetical protein FRB95_005004 [Tulasnella sp. JGI-2019a]|nr:hypothetical protein FRB95_005004 [Tulasnella sp. JGI-2019a]